MDGETEHYRAAATYTKPRKANKKHYLAYIKVSNSVLPFNKQQLRRLSCFIIADTVKVMLKTMIFSS